MSEDLLKRVMAQADQAAERLERADELEEQVRILTLGNQMLRDTVKVVCDELEERVTCAYHCGLIDQQRYAKDMALVGFARGVLTDEKAPQQRG